VNASAGRLPDFFLVGHQKSGTTAIFEMLRQHPQVFLPPIKEPWFFGEELRDRPPPRPQGIAATIEQYAALFAAATPAQRIGDASPQYLWSRTAAEQIARACPEAQIVAVLREPASYLRSLHLQFVETNIEVESDLQRALELEPSRRQGHEVPRHTYWPQMLLYSEHTHYVEQLRRFRERFPAERVKVLIYDDFLADNLAAVGSIVRFLGLDDSVTLAPVHANPTVSPRSQRLNELVHAVGVGRGPASRALKQAIKTITPAGPRRRAFYAVRRSLVFGSPPAEDERLMRALRERFAPEVHALADYLDRDLIKLWRYDELG
jgi:sulfotransferase family protein